MPPKKKDKGKERARDDDIVEVDKEEQAHNDTLSFNETVQFVVEFLEVAFHTILYIRQVYPSYIFMRVKKYDTPVWKSRVPLLTDYLSDAARAVGEQLSLGTVRQVCLTIRSVRTGRFLETFAFDFTFLGLSRLFFASTQDKDLQIANGPTRGQLAMHLRGMLVKLTVVESLLSGELNEETTFDIGVKMQDDVDVDPTYADRSKGSEPLWIPSQPKEDQMVSIPIRTTNLGPISMQMFVQENMSKADDSNIVP
ncbi:DNA-binding protein [Cystobasidium minutum MCA 4210]|uniref:DNA-binding protein n=1 Tax=Cystobasidium minutum MCA 4210 TaxID=1397322 RepID=UPI0034CDC165|eukprot:jgi/Rhomi1/49994/CE49993_1250